MDSKQHTFGKHEKLKSKKTIDLLFNKGKVINAYPIKAIYHNKEVVGAVFINVGVSVPKRNIKLAVNRNLIKRRMREAYRLNNEALKLQLKKQGVGYDVMFIYHSSQILSYQEIESKIKVILTRLTELGAVVVK